MKKAERRSKTAATVHGTLSLASVLAVTAIAVLISARSAPTPSHTAPIFEMGVAHQSPATLFLSVSTGRPRSLIDIQHKGNEPIDLHLPASWQLREVRAGKLGDIPSSVSGSTMKQWRLPPGPVLSFVIPESDYHVLATNLSKPVLQIVIRTINLNKNTVEDNSILVQKMPVRLW